MQNKYQLDTDQLRKDIRTQGLEVILLSNPRNPTGQVVQGDELKELVQMSRETSTTLILDEVSIFALSMCHHSLLTVLTLHLVLLVVHLSRKGAGLWQVRFLRCLHRRRERGLDHHRRWAHKELAPARLPCLLGRRSHEPHHRALTVRLVP